MDFDQVQIFDHFECMVFEPYKFKQLDLFSDVESSLSIDEYNLTENNNIDNILENNSDIVSSVGHDAKEDSLNFDQLS